MYGAQKAKGLFSKLKYQKFQAPISKWDVLFTKKKKKKKKKSNVMICEEAKMKSFKDV